MGEEKEMSDPRLIRLVSQVLGEDARRGSTTKAQATATCVNRITRSGGPAHFGIGSADLLMCLRNIVGTEVTHQLKRALPPETFDTALRSCPPAVAQMMKNLPNWIAQAEGPNAKWVPSLQATPEEWRVNFNLKEYKALQTLRRADISRDIARFLDDNGYSCLEDFV
jgi:hypothetical protein